jgi:signal transduction histidine kinase
LSISSVLNDEILLASILESTSDGLLILDNEFGIFNLNSSFLNMFNLPADFAREMNPWRWSAMIEDQLLNPDEFINTVQNIVDNPTLHIDYMHLKDGRIMERIYRPLKHNNLISGILLRFKDITERENLLQLEKSIFQKNKLLEEQRRQNDLKAQIVSALSHDLKTPVNIIYSAAQLIENTHPTESACSYCVYLFKQLKTMKQNCHRLVRLINNFIDLNKIDTGYFRLNLHNWDIIKVIEDITLSIAEYTNSKQIELVFDTEIEEKLLACDAEQLERVILNLLSNAIKFTPSNGKIEVNIKDKSESILISIKDSGTGIPGHMLDTIFEPYEQVDFSLRKKVEGSGLGLSIVKSIIDMHEGTIKVASEPGKGSEFLIELPVKILDCQGTSNDALSLNSKVERIHIEFSDIYS